MTAKATSIDQAGVLDGVDLVKAVRRIVGEADTLYFRLGAMLSQVRDSRIAKRLPFDQKYVTRNFPMSFRRAMYLISIHDSFTRAGIGERRLRGLAWSKAKEIARLPKQQLRANFKRLAEYAHQHTRQELIAKINGEFEVRSRRA